MTINAYNLLSELCSRNNIIWLDPLDNSVQYTFHADSMGHFSLIDHMLVSECLVRDRNLVAIHVDDSNISDNYAISCSIDAGAMCGIQSKLYAILGKMLN